MNPILRNLFILHSGQLRLTERQKDQITMKTRIVHIDIILKAFESYLQSQLIPKDLIPAEIHSFSRELAKQITKDKFGKKEGKEGK